MKFDEWSPQVVNLYREVHEACGETEKWAYEPRTFKNLKTTLGNLYNKPTRAGFSKVGGALEKVRGTYSLWGEKFNASYSFLTQRDSLLALRDASNQYDETQHRELFERLEEAWIKPLGKGRNDYKPLKGWE
ncbi:MAG TPA: hypothetical protein ENN60_01100 [archaeon]|nr:hypothetical protein [archaeon]